MKRLLSSFPCYQWFRLILLLGDNFQNGMGSDQCPMRSLMMTSSNWNIFRVTGPLWGGTAGHRWIPFTKPSDAELWCFLWSALEQTPEQTLETPVIWDAVVLIMASLWCLSPASGTKYHDAILMASAVIVLYHISLLWSSDAIWWHRSELTLAQTMACCLTATSHYLNQCWLLISKVYDIHMRVISQWVPKALFCMRILKKLLLKSLPHPIPGAKS